MAGGAATSGKAMGTRGILDGLAILAACLSFSCSGGPAPSEVRLLTYNASDGVRSLDPGRATDLESMWVVDQLYEGLLELDQRLEVKPALAEAWSVSPDGLSYGFRLRRGAVFHDGSAVTAGDVVESFRRLLDASQALPGRWVLSDLRDAGGMEVLREDSLVLHLARPQPVFPGLLATPHASILKGGGWNGQPDTEDLGSGPFELKGWLPETAMVLRRFPNYWMRDDSGVTLPYIEGVRIEFNREPGAEFLGFRLGRYDFVSNLDPEWIKAMRDDEGQWSSEWEGRVSVHQVPFLRTDYIGCLVDSAALASGGFPVLPTEVRRAMSMAVDRAALVREWRAGQAKPATGFVPPGMPGFSSAERPGRQDLEFRPEEARQLLSDQGIGPEPPLRRLTGLVLGSKAETADLAAALQHAWAEFGIDVEIDIAPSTVDAERVAKSQVPLFRKSWLADYADAENFMGLFHPDRWCPSGPNYTHFADDAVTAMLDSAQGMQPGAGREAVLREAESRVLDAMPVIPLWHDQVVHLVSTHWEGWSVSPTNRLDLRRVRRAQGAAH